MFIFQYIIASILVGTGATVALYFLLFVAFAFVPESPVFPFGAIGSVLVGPYLIAAALALCLPGIFWSRALVGRVQAKHRRLARLPYQMGALILTLGIGFTFGLDFEESQLQPQLAEQTDALSYPVASPVRICAQGPMHQVDSIAELPNDLRAQMASEYGDWTPIADRNAPYNTTGESQQDLPSHRFVLAAANEHCVVVTIEHGGGGRGVDRWIYSKSNGKWRGVKENAASQIPQQWGALIGPRNYDPFRQAASEGAFVDAR